MEVQRQSARMIRLLIFLNCLSIAHEFERGYALFLVEPFGPE